MMEKVTDGKAYRLYRDSNKHMNTKINKNGRSAAVQLDNEKNRLSPLEYEEIDLNEVMNSKTPQEINPYVKWFLDEVVASFLNYALEIGTDKILCFLSEKGIPTVKKTIREFTHNTSIYMQGVRDGILGKETKVSRLFEVDDSSENKKIEQKIESQIHTKISNKDKEIRSVEEAQQLLDLLEKSVFVTAICIRILTNTIINDNGENSEALEIAKKQLEELNTQEVMDKISLMLEDKNRELMDKSTYQILSAFRQGNLIVEGESIPITNYLSNHKS